MRRIGIAESAMMIVCFVPALTKLSTEERTYLEKLWDACERVGMMSAVPGLGGTCFPKPADGDTKQGTLAARRAESPSSSHFLREAFLVNEQEVTALVALIAEQGRRVKQARWAAIDRQWLAAQAGGSRAPERLLGHIKVFSGLYRAGRSVKSEDIAKRVHDSVPGAPNGSWWQDLHETSEGFLLWEVPASAAQDGLRTICMLAPMGAGQRLDHWLWNDGSGRLAPFVRYLLHASIIDYEARVHRELEPLQAVRARIELALKAVDGVLLDSGGVTRQELGLAEEALRHAQRETTTLMIAATELQDLRASVDAASTNAIALTPPRARPILGSTLFDRDRSLASWVLLRIEHDIAYLANLLGRSQASLTWAAHRVSDMRADVQEDQQRRLLLQTIVLGGLVTGLTAVQALEVEIPLERRLAPPLSLLLTALAVAIPLALLRSTTLASERALLAASSVTGAAGGWLAAAWMSWQPAPGLQPFGALSLGAGIGAVALPCLAWSLRRLWHLPRSKPR